MEMSSDELGKMLTKLTEEIESQRKVRHDTNNRLAAALGSMSKSVLELDEANKAQTSALLEIGSQVQSVRVEVGLVSKTVTELDHILRGVDGENGIRGEWRQMKQQLRFMEMRIVGLTVLLVSAGVYGGKVLF